MLRVYFRKDYCMQLLCYVLDSHINTLHWCARHWLVKYVSSVDAFARGLFAIVFYDKLTSTSVDCGSNQTTLAYLVWYVCAIMKRRIVDPVSRGSLFSGFF